MRQMPKEYIVTMRLPGLNKDEVSLELKDKYLTVSTGRETRKKKSGNNYREEQASSRSFVQIITLPDDSRKKDITSEYRDGNLTIRIPRNLKAQNDTKGRSPASNSRNPRLRIKKIIIN